MRAIAFFILILLAVIFAIEPAYGQQKWWNKNWKYRRVVKVTRFGQRWTDTDIARTAFYLCEDVRKNGADIRVVDAKGKLTKHKVIFAEPCGRCELIFQTHNGKGTYYVYYGNKGIKQNPNPLRVKRGLVLETRERPNGPCKNWQQYQQLLERSKVIYGRGLRRRIYDGFNPYGPSDAYLSIYRGYIRCPKDGLYRFATNSDDGSFLKIDGKMVVEWAGAHGPTATWGQRNGEIELKAGTHKIEYYHEERTNGQICVAGWWKPGDAQVSLIPDEAFVSFLTARAGKLEAAGTDPVCDFTIVRKSDLQLPNLLMCEFKFSSYSYGSSDIGSYLWEFGDGTSSTEDAPHHIYLSEGAYYVKLTVGIGDKKAQTTRKLYAGILFVQSYSPLRQQQYAEIVRGYDFVKLTTPALLSAFSLFELTDEHNSATAVCRQLIERPTELKHRDLFRATLAFGKNLLKYEQDCEGALAAFNAIIERNRRRRWVMEAKIGVADCHFRLQKRYEQARKEYQAVIDNYSSASVALCKLAQIRIGDTYREQGDYNKALEAYKASGKYSYRVSHKDNSLQRGEFAVTVESLYQRGEYETALKKLDRWEWEFPEDKLSGNPTILRARVNLKLKRFVDVLEDLGALVKVNTADKATPTCNYLPEAEFIIAQTYFAQEEFAKALAAFKRVIDNYPETELKERANEMLARCNEKLKKKETKE